MTFAVARLGVAARDDTREEERKDGEPDAQKMLTTNAGDVSSLAVAPLNKGSVVAWISDREGEARLFGARLNEGLVKAAPEQRLSPAAGFTGLSLARHGDEAWLAATRRDDWRAFARNIPEE